MALRINKTHKGILSDMVLGHRVAVRAKAQSNRDTDSEYWNKLDAQHTTQYALDIALGDDETGYKMEHLLIQRDRGDEDAMVALIRLRWLGVITEQEAA